MRPLLFLIIAVVLMILTVWVAFDVPDYGKSGPTIGAVVTSSLFLGAIFLIVAGISALAAVITGNAPLHWLMVVVLSLLLAFGVWWMLFLGTMSSA
jgi:hypothetical protein